MTSRRPSAGAAVRGGAGAVCGLGTRRRRPACGSRNSPRSSCVSASPQGATTVLVPIGGTEQNGAHLVLGKHNVRVRVLAARIAEQLGDTLVAPVVAYVPEGDIDPPTQHMRHAGTLSVPTAAFESVLEGAARSLRHHGFRHVVLLGDHGGYQASLARVAGKLNRAWGGAARPDRAGGVLPRRTGVRCHTGCARLHAARDRPACWPGRHVAGLGRRCGAGAAASAAGGARRRWRPAARVSRTGPLWR